MDTRFTRLVGCDLPIQCAAMSGIATAPLAAAVSNAGGLGMLGVGRRGPDLLGPMIDEVLAATSRPVGAGFIVEFLDEASLALAAERLPIVEFFWGTPDPALVERGRIVGWQVGSVDEARAAVDAGCSYVVLQGVQAGGHVRGHVEREPLLAATRAVLADAAIVAAGGIGTADDVRRTLAAGADAVRIGTRFVATHESMAHDRYVELLAAASDHDTELSEAFRVGWPDAVHRVLSASVAAAGGADDVVGTMPARDGTSRDVPRHLVSPPTRQFSGRIEAMALYAGAGSVGAVRGRTTAASVIDELCGRLAT